MTPDFDKTYAAFLFDLDGTLLTSIISAERCWTRWANLHGLDAEALLRTIHGKRALDTMRELALPGLDPDAEAAALTRMEIEDVADIEPIGGAAAFLAAIPADRWAVVTSAPRALALARMTAAGLPTPPLLICAEDVENGKPAPDGFRLGARRLGFEAADCLVFEDAPAGIEAGKAAGADVLVITQMHSRAMAEPDAQSIVNYAGVGVRSTTTGIAITLL
ncbi:HAD-IA family hydrolase [Novosphingobium sp.]|uniref:HAD-IA family hydrolase n=1 Tax=Novosphingobium sp. TaxID=1874826 RepID=UPI003B51A527